MTTTIFFLVAAFLTLLTVSGWILYILCGDKDKASDILNALVESIAQVVRITSIIALLLLTLHEELKTAVGDYHSGLGAIYILLAASTAAYYRMTARSRFGEILHCIFQGTLAFGPLCFILVVRGVSVSTSLWIATGIFLFACLFQFLKDFQDARIRN